MNPNIPVVLTKAFTNLNCILHGDCTLVDLSSIDPAGIGLCLSPSVEIGYGDHRDEAYTVRFTWEELMDSALDISGLAMQRWEAAKAAALEEHIRHQKERQAEEAAATKRRRAYRKRTQSKRELATLARLAAKHHVALS